MTSTSRGETAGAACAWELLRDAILSPPDAAAVRRLHAVASRITDWESVLHWASAHRVRPLLYRHLKECGPGAGPAPVMGRLQRAFLANATRNLALTREMFQILDCLSAERIVALPVRGPVLAVQAFGSVAMREFDDLDFMVRPEDLPRARDALVAAGHEQHLKLKPAEERAHLRAGYGFSLAAEYPGATIELASAMAPDFFSYAIPPEAVWDRAQRIQVEDREVSVVSADVLILMLAAHGAKHAWERLAWVLDLAAVVAGGHDLAWPEIVRLSRKCGGYRMLLLGLRLARGATGVTLPPEIEGLTDSDPVVTRLADSVNRALQVSAFGLPPGLPFRFHLRVRERWRDRVRYVTRLALTPSQGDWRAFNLPGRFYPLYYLLRPLRLLRARLRSPE